MRIASAEPRGAAFPWLQLWLTTATLVLVFIFHWKWTRPIYSYPLELPKIKYTFVERPEFYQFNEATQERWHASMSEKWWKTRWRAPDGGDSVRVFSMFHRIHCLTALREEFTLLTTDPKRHESFYAENDDKTGSRLHLGHCFDLLRQEIQCAADMTLEPLEPGYVEGDGMDVVHECRDWGLLKEFAESQPLHT